MKIQRNIPITIVADWNNPNYCNDSACRFLLWDEEESNCIFQCELYDEILKKEAVDKPRRCSQCIQDFGIVGDEIEIR